eukprot:CAMPEP_0202791902 /NCGR_PEP_ID=MMETSP1388-20130828/82568_1 /ASSEMBLY_ACC=CAM_ASM_000864 /TAXON_ID=37098 /ORGANISM="Isochrysis sp, Strain CCMP1244" /LENGTH=140 /DNA_ID=CAMNT_0049461681 /DNA_START=18 /DNA_END=437 /DNA_ORIENTATION=-
MPSLVDCATSCSAACRAARLPVLRAALTMPSLVGCARPLGGALFGGVRRLSSSQPQPPLETAKKRLAPKPPEDAFDKGLPFLFRNNASIPAMLTLLALIYGYNAFSDWTAEPEMPDEEKGQALAGGRVLMDDGSIVRRTG